MHRVKKNKASKSLRQVMLLICLEAPDAARPPEVAIVAVYLTVMLSDRYVGSRELAVLGNDNVDCVEITRSSSPCPSS